MGDFIVDGATPLRHDAQVMITDKNFADWHSDVFGYGYGSGEEHWLPALHQFFMMLRSERGPYTYGYQELEGAFGPLAAWLLINTLCGADIIEYGTSPRFGWLTSRGMMIREYVVARTADDLEEMVGAFPQDQHCLPDYCNCVGTPATCNPIYMVTR